MAYPAEGAPPRDGPVALTARARPFGVFRDASLGWLALATLVALALRGFRLGANSLWIDEWVTAWVAAQPFGRIADVALHNDAFEPPVYFWLVHLAASVAGDSETALRLISVVAGTAIIPLLWLLVRTLGGTAEAASTTAALAAVHPLLLWYSQEARPYALLTALALASLIGLASGMQRGSTAGWFAYLVFGALALLVHAVAVFVPAVGLLWVLLSGRARQRAIAFALATAGMLLAISPFLVALGRAVMEAGSTGSPPRPITGLEIPYTLFTFVAGYSLGPAVREIQDVGWANAVRAHPFQTAVAILTLLVATLVALKARRRAAALLAVLLWVPILAAFAGSVVTTKAFNVRYTVPAVAGLLGLLGLGLAELPRRQRRAALGVLVVVFLCADLQWFTVSRYWKEDSRAAVACLAHRLPPGARVAVAPKYMADPLNHYMARSGADLTAVGVTEPAELRTEPRPFALALTRFHHVPNAGALVETFGGDAEESTAFVTGYRLFFAGLDSEGPAPECGERP